MALNIDLQALVTTLEFGIVKIFFEDEFKYFTINKNSVGYTGDPDEEVTIPTVDSTDINVFNVLTEEWETIVLDTIAGVVWPNYLGSVTAFEEPTDPWHIVEMWQKDHAARRGMTHEEWVEHVYPEEDLPEAGERFR